MSGLHGINSSRQGGPPRPRTALVVDSDFGSVYSLAHMLREGGFDVFQATSFEEGKFLWSTESPDVLVVDIRLGQFNGLQLLMRARSDRPDLQAVITSAFPDAVLEAETRRFGGIFMVKPVDPRHVLDAVQGLASSAKVPSPVTPPFLLERRRSPMDRRQTVIPGYFPDRRKGDRRVNS
jgi:two-component system, response regulator RegA